jgi:glutathione S-transferase
MNCQQFSCALVGSTALHPMPSLSADAQSHLAGCRHCAANLAIHSRMASMAVPAMPPALASRCRARVNRRLAFADGRLRPHRYILFGTVLALAAAAAMLAWQMGRSGRDAPIRPPGAVATIQDGGPGTADVNSPVPQGSTLEKQAQGG